jgi:hypothetical protein
VDVLRTTPDRPAVYRTLTPRQEDRPAAPSTAARFCAECVDRVHKAACDPHPRHLSVYLCARCASREERQPRPFFPFGPDR